MSPTRIQRRRTPGWRAADESTNPNGYRYVGRGSKWGNPFAVVRTDHPTLPWRLIDRGGKSRSLVEEPQRFARCDKRYGLQMAARLFELHTGPMGLYEYDPDTLADLRRELGGRDLMCYCPLPEPGETDYCHGQWLLELANPAAALADLAAVVAARADGIMP